MTSVPTIIPRLEAVAVPNELRDLHGWLIWRFEQFIGEAKPRKIPYWADGRRRNGRQGSDLDRKSLVPFSVARDAAIRRGFDGVGFAPLSDFGYTFLDFDNCVDLNGVPADEVLSLVTRTYCEYSPSGRGVRAVLRGNLGNNKSPTTNEQFGFETFSSSGFVTITGNVLPIRELIGCVNHIADVDQHTQEFCDKRFGLSVAALNTDDFMAGYQPKLGLPVEKITELLSYLDPSMSRESWIKIGMALHHEFGGDEIGFDLWDEWSSDGYTYPGTEGLRIQWNSFRPTPKRRQVTMATVIHMAKGQGYGANVPVNAILKDWREGGRQFFLLDRSAIMEQPPLRWRLKGIFPQAGIGAIYGPSASGKSFLGLDLGVSVALGERWFSHRSFAAPVTYIMLEGEAGLRNRIQAWEEHNSKQIPPNFMAMAQPFELAELEQVEELADLVPKEGVVIIDTLNRAAPGLDENSSQDMGRVLAGMKRLQEITGGLVLIVHHTGKDASKGLRGHSSLFAALDGAIEVERSSNSRCWSAAKVKDGEDGKQVLFKLNIIDLGTDSDGDPVTSCAVSEDIGAIFQAKPPSGKHQIAALSAIRRALGASSSTGQGGAPSGSACIRFEEAVTQSAPELAGVEKKRRAARAREAVQGLVSSGHLHRGLDDNEEEWVWL